MYFKCIIIVHIVWLGFSAAFPNLATYGTAIQSSVYSDSKNSYDASRVIDGNTNQLFTARSCCHTAVGQSSAWWRLDLGSPAYIHRVVLYYRKYQNDRLRGYYLYVSDSFSQGTPNYGHLCYHYPLNSELPTSIQNKTCDVIGRYVVFYNERNREDQAFVELCEVEIFGCYVGRYGSQCEFACSDNCNDVTCSIWDGSCTSCKAGFTGDRCDQVCGKGTYGMNCSLSCGNCKSESCNHRTGVCPIEGGCKPGYHGLKCSEGCNASTYGESCRLECRCLGGIACNNVNGQCPKGLCELGWESNTCSETCGNGKYGINCSFSCGNCKNESCDHRTGVCPIEGGCKAGYHGLKCSEVCDKGTYGINCSMTCENCKNESCNHRTGICPIDGRCKAGYHGSKCSEGCNASTYGENCQLQCHCLDSNACNNVNGRCPDGLCDSGWKSNTCSEICDKGKYGSNCSMSCDNCKNESCNHQTGICLTESGCKAGYQGLRCSKGCTLGTYGPNCQEICDNCKDTECNQFNGTCTHGCSAGWKGRKCKKVCGQGAFGQNCRQKCTNCKTDNCNRFNGDCNPLGICKSGWKGPGCKHACDTGSYGINCSLSCSNCINESCDHRTGKCHIDGGCKIGYHGSECSEACDTGSYGINCSLSCSNCINESCDHRTGKCHIDGGCKIGYHGSECNEACDTGSYGINCSLSCSNCINESCDHRTGKCHIDGGCKIGYHGSECSEACDTGSHGINCSLSCSNCINESCDHRTGKCHIDGGCKIGYHGSECSEACSSAHFGYNCAETCTGCLDDDCEPFSGNCTKHGCRNGYTGYRCHLRETLPPLKIDKTQWIFIGGVVGAVLVAIAVILVGVLICRSYSNDTFESPQYAQVEKENQMTSKGVMVELGNVSSSEDSDTNDNRPDNLYLNTESNDADNLYSNTETKNLFSEYNIAVGSLPSVAKMKRKNNSFKKEYAMLPKGLKFPYSEGEKEENSKKNRYLTTFPYDHSRVQLDMYDANTDYINANYIKNYSNDKAYIATQGPKKNTLSDFWHMIWQENVDTIIMVTNLMEGDKKKCDQYWPELTHKKVVIGEFTLQMLEERENTVYIYRSIQVTCEHTDRKIQQFHFTKWPDHDVPDKTNLVNFYRKVKSMPSNGSGPMVVHCSAGVGRTGTFIALDALYEHGKATGFVNIMEYTHMMRQDRMNMIQTVEQYATVYDVLVEAFTVPQSAIPKQDFLNILDSRLIKREFQKLQDLKPVIESNKFLAGKLKENVPKNAVQNLLPHDDYRPYLMSYGRSSNDYINAVKIPSFREGRHIFVTQYPLQNTIGDLWSLVYDNDCRTMVILDELFEDVIPESTSHRFSNDNFIISRISSNTLQDKVTISLRHKNKKEERSITVFVYNDWEDTNMIPNSTKTMIDFTEIVSRTTRQDRESLVVICRDGCTRCGIYVTLDLALEKMEIDEEIDILQVVRRIQTRRPQFLSNIEQFEFCYYALREILDSESVYANSGNLLSAYR
ncbi:uncharacterized protein LOC134701585 [Mytilus trossulus]|uniref:uncharacterized protein LOC134701585 n=1 Tax=Mytilus trossulus TaxID=6551 RepID=UPI003007C7AA